jgi:hypothetical protein
MSCLSVTITNLNPPLHIGVGRLGGIKANVSRYDIPFSFEISDALKRNHLKLSCGIVCSVGDIHYLYVSPDEVQWITPDEGIVYMVESNTNWNILVN